MCVYSLRSEICFNQTLINFPVKDGPRFRKELESRSEGHRGPIGPEPAGQDLRQCRPDRRHQEG